MPPSDKFALVKAANREGIKKNLSEFKETLKLESAKVIDQLKNKQSSLSEAEKSVLTYVDDLMEELLKLPQHELLRTFTDLLNEIKIFKASLKN